MLAAVEARPVRATCLPLTEAGRRSTALRHRRRPAGFCYLGGNFLERGDGRAVRWRLNNYFATLPCFTRFAGWSEPPICR